MKRFYKNVSISQENLLLLDMKHVRTPKGNALLLPTRPLARAVADEWEAQDKKIDTATMPLTKLANIAIDRVTELRDEVVNEILGYGQSDLLCYRAEDPMELTARQHQKWQPLLDWADDHFGLRLNTATGIMHVTQPPESFERVRRYLTAQSEFALAAVHTMVGLLGSLVLALAILERRLGAGDAFSISRVDEKFQAEKWGRDAEADARADAHLAELNAAARFLTLSRTR